MNETVAIPGMYAAAPYPCNTQLLITWLNVHFGFALGPSTYFYGPAGVIETVMKRYGVASIPAKDAAKGLYPSDLWTFVRETEKRIAGGQKSLFIESETTA